MINVVEVTTSGSTATFTFELFDKKNKRLSNIPDGIATVSLRRSTTSRIAHELISLPAILDTVNATVTLYLSSVQTEKLTLPIDTTPKSQIVEIIGDVRLVQGLEVNYFGPFMFSIRLPETYGQSASVSVLSVKGGLSTDNIPESAELTIDSVGNNIPFPPLQNQYRLIWRLATEPDLVSLVYASDPTGYNQIGGSVLWPQPVTLADGRVGKVLVSKHALTYISDTIRLA